MTMQPDIDDISFMEGMKNLLGFDDDKVEELLDQLDKESLLALTDAISKQDKTAAEQIIGSFESDLNSLFRAKEIRQQEKEDGKKKRVKAPEDHEFQIGDDVAIKTANEDTGEDSFVTATVYKPKAPGNTIGVKIDGKTKMVDKDDVYLNEMVMGMVGVPDIARIKQLAGIQVPPSIPPSTMPTGPLTVPPVTMEPAEDEMNPQTMEDQMCVVSQAISALDSLEAALPNVRLADLRVIRQRMTEITQKMNESLAVTPAGRARKL